MKDPKELLDDLQKDLDEFSESQEEQIIPRSEDNSCDERNYETHMVHLLIIPREDTVCSIYTNLC